METLNKNWFAITLTAVVFVILGFLLGRQAKQDHGCPMMNGPHNMMFMKGGPHKMSGENMFMFKSEDGKEIEWIEDIDIQKEEGEDGEKKIKIHVKVKEDQKLRKVITVNEVDPLRDQGLVFSRKREEAGVKARS